MIASVPIILDKIVKTEVQEKYTKRGEKPPWLRHIAGRIVSMQKKLEYTESGLTLVGVLDGLMRVEETGEYVIIDYKVSSMRRNEESMQRRLQQQMDAYAYLCEQNGLKPVRKAILVFFSPSIGEGCEHRADLMIFPFQVHLRTLSVSTKSAEEQLKRVWEVVMRHSEPARNPTCAWCSW